MIVPIMLRADERATLTIPADLSEQEAERISRVVMAYVDRDRVFSVPPPSWDAYAAALSGLEQPEELPPR